VAATDIVQNENPAAGNPGITTYTSLAKSDFTDWTDAIRIGVHAVSTYIFCHTQDCRTKLNSDNGVTFQSHKYLISEI